MSTPKRQRGPLLSSVVMVMLATIATGLLAVIGFQALPESVIPSTFGGEEPETRRVDVSESPAVAPPSVRPTGAQPTATVVPSATKTAGPRSRGTGSPNGSDTPVTSGTAGPTAGPTKAPATTAPPKKTISPSPTATKPSPTATSTTQAPSPAPTCGTGRKPRCPKAPSGATASPTTFGSYSATSYDAERAPSYSSTESSDTKAKGKGKGKKAGGRQAAKRSR